MTETTLDRLPLHVNAAGRPKTALMRAAIMDDPALTLTAHPSFAIDPDSSVFCTGSCFANRLRACLIALGVPVDGTTIRYTPIAIEQTLRLIANDHLFEPSEHLISLVDGRIYDPLSRERVHTGYENIERAYETITRMHRRLCEFLRGASAAAITVGQIEAFGDRQTGMVLNNAPPRTMVEGFDERYKLRLLTHTECVDSITSIVHTLRALNPEIGIVISVSPVPAGVSLAVDHIVEAACLAKSRLRSAVQEALEMLNADGVDRVDYFPSYEMVAMQRANIFTLIDKRGRPDPRHVPQEFFAEVIAPRFLQAYLPELAGRPIPLPLPKVSFEEPIPAA